MRIFALSDIHVDYQENMRWIENISALDYRRDALILAGDATHDLERLKAAFDVFKQRFLHVFFIPGNHELWVMKGERGNSLNKLDAVLSACDQAGVHHQPLALGEGKQRVWVVPLHSWYVTPDQGRNSLFIPKRGGDQGMKVWSDAYFVKWPQPDFDAAGHMLDLNRERVHAVYDAPVVSFSHFLSRQDLLFVYGTDMEGVYRRAAETPPAREGEGEGFNFSRVAGSRALETQIRTLGSRVHVHGHQHRNRFRHVDGVLYVSHCLGYRHERQRNLLVGIDQGPLQIYDSQDWNPHQKDPY